MKKICFLLLFSLLIISVIYASDYYSIGFGGDFGFVFTNFTSNLPNSINNIIEDEIKKIFWGRGGFWFYLDLIYLKLNTGGKYYVIFDIAGIDYKETQSYLNMGIMGKYPFTLNNNISIFPFLGFDWQVFAIVEMSDGDSSYTIGRYKLPLYNIERNYFDRFVFNFGCGVDFNVSRLIYIRTMFKYGINLNTKTQRDMVDLLNDLGYEFNILNHGPSIKIGIGLNLL